MKHKYIAHVTTEPSVEETIFEPVDDAPQIPAHYERDKKKFGAYKNGNSYTFGVDEDTPEGAPPEVVSGERSVKPKKRAKK